MQVLGKNFISLVDTTKDVNAGLILNTQENIKLNKKSN